MDQQILSNSTNNNSCNDDTQNLSKSSSLQLKNNIENTYINENKHENLINTLGVSKRLGSSVLNELDSRTDAKFKQLLMSNKDNHGEPLPDLTFSERFNITHDSQFKTMESIDMHYSVKFSNRNGNEINDNIYKTPSRKNLQPEQLHSSSIKRLKVTQNLLNTPPPILDITRRIRRLRLRNSLSNNNHNIGGHGARDSHDSRSITNSKIKNTPITKPQKPLKPPSFLIPTITSLNRMKRSDNINDLNSKIKSQKVRVPNKSNNHSNNNNNSNNNSNSGGGGSMNRTTSLNTLYRNRGKEITNREAGGRRIKSTGNVVTNSNDSLSVFERLYKQSTVSRSVSMNNVTNNNISNKNEAISEKKDKITRKNSNSNSQAIKFNRSKTTPGLSDHITSNKNSNVLLKTRPAWR